MTPRKKPVEQDSVDELDTTSVRGRSQTVLKKNYPRIGQSTSLKGPCLNWRYVNLLFCINITWAIVRVTDCKVYIFYSFLGIKK